MTVVTLTQTGNPTTAMQGTIATTVLTVTSITGALSVGNFIFGTSVTAGTYITSFGTGVGGIGTYNLSQSSTVAVAEAMTTQFGWLVPADWSNASNKVECIGSGASGTAANTGQAKGGGAGGMYASRANLSLTAATYVNYQVGSGNGGNSVTGPGSTMFQCTSTASAGASAVGAQGGANTTGGTNGGPAGLVGNSTGSTVVAGQGGGTGLAPPGGGGGGGAPGGPTGTGGTGGNSTSTTGGAGGTGDGGTGGAGGSGGTSGASPTNGTAGTELGGGIGPGGGGGGGAAATGHQNGADGALYGGAGGGGGTDASTAGTNGVGKQGVIIITYAPVNLNTNMLTVF